MLARLDEQQQVLNAVAADASLRKWSKELGTKLFSYEEHLEVKALINALEPFKKATEMLSSDTQPTQGLVLPVLVKLNQVLERSNEDSELITNVKLEMKRQLISRTEDKDFALFAAFLTPSTKSMQFAANEERQKAEELVLNELTSLYSNVAMKVEGNVRDENDNNVVPTLPALPELHEEPHVEEEVQIIHEEGLAAKKLKCEFEVKPETSKDCKKKSAPVAADWLDDIIYVSETKPLPPDESARNELQAYTAEPASNPRMCSDLEWWKTHENKYGRLAKLAKKYLCIPASSVSAERVFSMTGNIISKKRSRLKSDLVEKIVFLNKNKFLLLA